MQITSQVQDIANLAIDDDDNENNSIDDDTISTAIHYSLWQELAENQVISSECNQIKN